MFCYVVQYIILGVSEGRVAFIFRVKQSKNSLDHVWRRESSRRGD
jgi:hypothetical protein